MEDPIRVTIEVSPRFANIIRETALHEYDRIEADDGLSTIIGVATDMVDARDDIKFSRETAISLTMLEIEKQAIREVFFRVADQLGVHPDKPGEYPIDED